MKYLQTDSVFDSLKNFIVVFLNPVNILSEPKQFTCFPLTSAWVQSSLSIICNNIRIFDASTLFLESALLCSLNCGMTNAPKFSCYRSRNKKHCRVLLFPFISDDRSAQSQTMLCSPVCVRRRRAVRWWRRALTAMRAQIMCLKGWRPVPAVTVGLGIGGSLSRAARTRLGGPIGSEPHLSPRGSSSQGRGLAGSSRRPDEGKPAPRVSWWSAGNSRRLLKNDALLWGGASFTSIQLRLGRAFVELHVFAAMPMLCDAKGPERLSFVLLSTKSWWFTNKSLECLFWWRHMELS